MNEMNEWDYMDPKSIHGLFLIYITTIKKGKELGNSLFSSVLWRSHISHKVNTWIEFGKDFLSFAF